MIDPEIYLNPDGTYNWLKFDQLTESEQISIKKTWDVCDWQRWDDRFGYMTLEKFRDLLLRINDDEFGDGELARHVHDSNGKPAEMTCIGAFGSFYVVLYIADPEKVPHVHVIDSATRGYIFNAGIRLDFASYNWHSGLNHALSPTDLNDFIEFMNEPSQNVHYRNKYEAAVNYWNDNNCPSGIQLSDGPEVLMPKYSKLMPYCDGSKAKLSDDLLKELRQE
jgi:hypothetical protein